MLDFPAYPTFHTSFIKSISTIPAGQDAFTLSPGDKVRVAFDGHVGEHVIVENSPERFSWKGSAFAGAFAGLHYMEFRASSLTAGATAFAHGENYDGWATWLFDEWWAGVMRKSVVRMYGEFVEDVKRRAEGVEGGNKA